MMIDNHRHDMKNKNTKIIRKYCLTSYDLNATQTTNLRKIKKDMDNIKNIKIFVIIISIKILSNLIKYFK